MKSIYEALKAWRESDFEKITIRPSSVDAFYDCPLKWADCHILGTPSIQGARAAIGTAIHEGAAMFWEYAIATKVRDLTSTVWTRVACDELFRLHKEGIRYDVGENFISATCEVTSGLKAYLEQIAPLVPIPDAVEKRYSINLDHPIVARVSGTVDYIKEPRIDDIKTSKRKPVPKYYTTQQSIYKLLAKENGLNITESWIQGVAFNKKVKGFILPLEADIPAAKAKVNEILGVLTKFYKGGDPAILFPADSSGFFCREKFCHRYNDCEEAQSRQQSFNPFNAAAIEETGFESVK